jgi:hypothetical protein
MFEHNYSPQGQYKDIETSEDAQPDARQISEEHPVKISRSFLLDKSTSTMRVNITFTNQPCLSHMLEAQELKINVCGLMFALDKTWKIRVFLLK